MPSNASSKEINQMGKALKIAGINATIIDESTATVLSYENQKQKLLASVPSRVVLFVDISYWKSSATVAHYQKDQSSKILYE